MKIFILFIITFIFLFESCNSKKWVHLSKEEVVMHLQTCLSDTSFFVSENTESLVTNEETAIKIAESVLFNLYGKNKIINERPYKVGQAYGYWVILGSPPKRYVKGGAFEIIINSKNAEIIEYSHGK